MPKDEKLLKKIDKLLKLYGVESEEERKKFLTDVEDAKYDEEEKETSGESEQEISQESVEETEKVESEEPKEEGEKEEVEESAETTEEETVEESGEEIPPATENESEESQEEIEPPTEEVANESEEVVAEEETKEEEVPEFDAKSSIDELKKSIEGLASRFQSIEETLAKLGTPIEEKPIGVSPTGNPIDESQDTTFDEINRKRIGY